MRAIIDSVTASPCGVSYPEPLAIPVVDPSRLRVFVARVSFSIVVLLDLGGSQLVYVACAEH